LIDAENVGFRKCREQRRVQLPRRLQIAPKGLLDDDPGALDGHCLAEAGNDRGKHARRNRQVVERPLRIAQRLAERIVRLDLRVIAVNVTQQGSQL
jgi:hypothetical protein